MKIQMNQYLLDTLAAQQRVNNYIKQFSDFSKRTQRLYYLRITEFLSFMCRNGQQLGKSILFTDKQTMKWMRQTANMFALARRRWTLGIVERFLESLVQDKVLSANPLTAMKIRYPKHGWKGIAKALRLNNPDAALKSLRHGPLFTGKFGFHAEVYLKMLDAARITIRHQKTVLATFNQFLRDHAIESLRLITPDVIQKWVTHLRFNRNNCRSRLFTLRRFFSYLSESGIIKSNPVSPEIIANVGPPGYSFRPHIYSETQVRDLLKESLRLRPHFLFRLKPDTCYTVLALLYTLGLRLSEALRLRIKDVNIDDGFIIILDSKFYKDRIIPFGPKLRHCLVSYLELRRTIFAPVKDNESLFVARSRTHVSEGQIRHVFRGLLKATGLRGAVGQTSPRLHDLRHTFAVVTSFNS